MSTVDAHVSDLAGRTAGDVITVRGKELAVDATVADARALFASGSVQLIPVLDGGAYTGAVTRDDLADAGQQPRIVEHRFAYCNAILSELSRLADEPRCMRQRSYRNRSIIGRHAAELVSCDQRRAST